MNKPISLGDLVMIVRACVPQLQGWIFVVNEFHYREATDCSWCGGDHKETFAVAKEPYANLQGDLCYAAPISWLKRIPPLEELEHAEDHDEITA